MPSYTSNSDNAHGTGMAAGQRALRFATAAVIASVVLALVGAELVSRFAFPRISRIEGRIRSDERETMRIGSPAPGAAPVILMAGNSLLLRGLEYPRLRSEMAQDARVVRLVVENTEFLDWYYGLHHLFAAGVRPSSVVLCLSIGQTTSSKTLGDYSARHLLGVEELLPVARDAGMDATQTSGFFLAHWSAFYGSRATIRNFILNKTAPGYAQALHSLADSVHDQLPADDVLLAKARSRIAALHQLCEEHGVELVVLVPPSLGPHNDLLALAASLENVNFDDPLPMGSLGSEFFRPDRVHLNEKGAAVFTDAILRYLRAHVAPEKQAGN